MLKKNIIIFVGEMNGKSTLTNFFTEDAETCTYPLKGSAKINYIRKKYLVSHDINEVETEEIKRIISGEPILITRRSKDTLFQSLPKVKFIFHFNDEKQIPRWLKRRALIYKLEIIK